MDLGVTMTPGSLELKIEAGKFGGLRPKRWRTRLLPKRLTLGWTNRLFVASAGAWRGFFPLSGDMLWNPDDEQAPYEMIFDHRL